MSGDGGAEACHGGPDGFVGNDVIVFGELFQDGQDVGWLGTKSWAEIRVGIARRSIPSQFPVVSRRKRGELFGEFVALGRSLVEVGLKFAGFLLVECDLFAERVNGPSMPVEFSLDGM